MPKVCVQCGVEKEHEGYSGSQWRKPTQFRRCKECVPLTVVMSMDEDVQRKIRDAVSSPPKPNSGSAMQSTTEPAVVTVHPSPNRRKPATEEQPAVTTPTVVKVNRAKPAAKEQTASVTTAAGSQTSFNENQNSPALDSNVAKLQKELRRLSESEKHWKKVASKLKEREVALESECMKRANALAHEKQVNERLTARLERVTTAFAEEKNGLAYKNETLRARNTQLEEQATKIKKTLEMQQITLDRNQGNIVEFITLGEEKDKARDELAKTLEESVNEYKTLENTFELLQLDNSIQKAEMTILQQSATVQPLGQDSFMRLKKTFRDRLHTANSTWDKWDGGPKIVTVRFLLEGEQPHPWTSYSYEQALQLQSAQQETLKEIPGYRLDERNLYPVTSVNWVTVLDPLILVADRDLPILKELKGVYSQMLDKNPFCGVLCNFLAPHECAGLVHMVNAIGFSNLSKTFDPAFHNGTRLLVNDPKLADMLWKRVKPLIPDTIRDKWETPWVAQGFLPRLAFYNYNEGEFHRAFTALEMDMEDSASPFAFDKPHHQETKMSAIFYLTRPEEGGSTFFYDHSREEVLDSIDPDVGMVVMCPQNIMREDIPVGKGVKCFIQADLVYACPEDRNSEKGEGDEGDALSASEELTDSDADDFTLGIKAAGPPPEDTDEDDDSEKQEEGVRVHEEGGREKAEEGGVRVWREL